MVKLSYIIVLDAVNLLHRIRRCVDVGQVALQFRLGPIVGLVAAPKTGPYMVPFSGRLLFDIWALTGTETGRCRDLFLGQRANRELRQTRVLHQRRLQHCRLNACIARWADLPHLVLMWILRTPPLSSEYPR